MSYVRVKKKRNNNDFPFKLSITFIYILYKRDKSDWFFFLFKYSLNGVNVYVCARVAVTCIGETRIKFKLKKKNSKIELKYNMRRMEVC